MAPVSNLLAFLFPIVEFIVKLILLATLRFPISEYVVFILWFHNTSYDICSRYCVLIMRRSARRLQARLGKLSHTKNQHIGVFSSEIF